MHTGLEDVLAKVGALSPVAASALRGAALWGGAGATLGALTPEEGQSRLRSAIYGGLGGAAVGGIRGATKLPSRPSAQPPPPPHSPPPPSPRMGNEIHDVAPFLRDVSSKADAKARFRQAARTRHPDMGGSTSSMQELNDQWAKAQAHPAYAKFAALYAQGRIRALRLFRA